VLTTEYLNNELFEKVIINFQKSKQLKVRYELLLEDLRQSYAKNKKIRLKLDNKVRDYNSELNNFDDLKKQLAVNFYILSENLAKYAKFNLIDIDDAIQEGVMICFEKIDKFDKNKGKAFNYMTTCIFNHFRQLYRTARNYNELKRKYQDHLINKLEKAMIQNKLNKNNFSKINEKF